MLAENTYASTISITNTEYTYDYASTIEGNKPERRAVAEAGGGQAEHVTLRVRIGLVTYWHCHCKFSNFGIFWPPLVLD